MKNLLITTFLLLGLYTYTQGTETNKSINVEGKATLKATPELIYFQVTITERDSDYSRCAQLALDKIQKVKKEFERNKLDVGMLKTQNYTIQEERKHDRQSGNSVLDGYRADIQIIIESKVSNKNNDRIFDIIKNHFTGRTRIYYGLADEQRVKMKEKIIDMAVKDAIAKAKILSKSAGVKLGDLVNIRYGDAQIFSNFQRPTTDMRLVGYAKSESDAGTISSLAPNEIQIRTNVVMSWAIK